MKKNLFMIIALSIIIGTKAQVGYHIQLPIGNGSSMHALNKDSLYTSVGVTGNSHMMFIDPNTKEWKYVNTNPLPNYGTPLMKDKNNGILQIPSSNSLQVTSDGWQTVTTSTASFPYVNKCPAGYYSHSNVGSSTTLYHSANGLNWTAASMPGFFTILAARNYGNKIVALAASSSFSNMVSLDGGLTYSNAPNTFTYNGTFLDFYMASVDTFIVFFNNTIAKSNNAGLTWSYTPLTFSITSVAVKNKNEFAIQVMGGTATFSYTTNGGSTWAGSTTNQNTAGGKLIYLNNYYYIYPSFRTNDYGATWDHFLPNMAGYAFSVDFNGNKGLLGLQNGQYSYSLDKGRSFKFFTNTINSNQDMMAAKVLSNGNFLGGDRKGQVYTSNDNGQTWIKKNTESLTPNSVRFLLSANENTIVLTRKGTPVVSVDAGASFTVVGSLNSGTHFQAVKPNGVMLDIADINGWQMSTFDINGTTSVVATYSSTGSETLGSFYMVDNNIGYIMTRDNTNKVNKVYRTTDGGVTFTPKTDIAQVVAGSSAYINSPFISGIPLFHCLGQDTVIITANFNNYYHVSYDGATTWSTVTTPFNNPTYGDKIYRMNFFTANSYIATTGDNFSPKGLYLKTQGGSSTTIGIKELNFIDKKEALVLFPNPSANNNLISFLNLEEEVQVNIFNMSGQFVSSSTTSSGSFSAEDLSSGVYIVRISDKNKNTRTAKLIIQ
ncbi:MAG: T9SS type A sorting domain-containing protein [Bacteroidetes bacterium]|nr:T9SS type A sorting domain-containing protein [Bacteroidota bacterium]